MNFVSGMNPVESVHVDITGNTTFPPIKMILGLSEWNKTMLKFLSIVATLYLENVRTLLQYIGPKKQRLVSYENDVILW